jgi:glutathione peroxidase-family protein
MFPSDSFDDEPGTNKEIIFSYLKKYKISFHVFAKSNVKGQGMNPLW